MRRQHLQSDSDLSDDSDIDLDERANGVEVVTSNESDYQGGGSQTELEVPVRSDSFEYDAKGEKRRDVDVERANGESSETDIVRANGVVEMEMNTNRTQLDFDEDVDDEFELQSFSSAMNHRRSMSATSSRANDADDEAKSASSDGTTESFDLGGLAGMVQMMRSHELTSGGSGDMNGDAGRLSGASAALQRLRISLFFIFLGQALSHFLVPITLVMLQPSSFYLVALYAFLTESAGLWQFGIGRRIDSTNRLTAARRLLAVFWLGLFFALIGVATLHSTLLEDEGHAVDQSSSTFVLVYGAMCVCGWFHKLGQYGLRRALLADWYFVVASSSDGSPEETSDFKTSSIVHGSVASKSHFHVRSLHMLSEVLLTLPVGAWLLVSDATFVLGFFAIFCLLSFWGTYTWLGWIYYDVLQLHAMKETLTSQDHGGGSRSTCCFPPKRPRTRVQFARTSMMSNSPGENAGRITNDLDEIDTLSDGDSSPKNGTSNGMAGSSHGESENMRLTAHDQLAVPADYESKGGGGGGNLAGERPLADQRSPVGLDHISLSPRGMNQVSYAPPFSFFGALRTLHPEDVFTSVIISALMRFTVLGPSVLMVGFMAVQGIPTVLIGVWASSMGGAAFIGSYVVTTISRSKSSGGILKVTRAITAVYFLVALLVMCLFVLLVGGIPWGMICILPATFAMTGSLVGQKMIVELEAPPLFHDALNTMEHVLTSGFMMVIFFSGMFLRMQSEFKYLAVLSFVGVSCASAMLLYWTSGNHASSFAGHRKLDGTSLTSNNFAHMHSKGDEDSLELGVIDSRASDVLASDDKGEGSPAPPGRHLVHLDELDAHLDPL